MRERVRFESVDYSVGWLAVLTVVIISLMVVQTGRVQGWLEDRVSFQVRMPDEGTYGLRAGADVQMLGTSAGRVSRVDIDEDEIIARVEMRPEFAKLVREDAVIRIRRAFVVAGDAFLDIDPGRGPFARLTEETEIPASIDNELDKSVAAILADLEVRIPQTLGEVQRTTSAIADLTERLADPAGDLNRTVANVRELSDSAADPRGPLQFLLTNIDLTKSLEEVLAEVIELTRKASLLGDEFIGVSAEVRPLVAEVRRTVEDARATLRDFRESGELETALGAGAESAQAIPGLIFQLEQTLAQIDRLTRDLQDSWIVGGQSVPAVRDASPAERLP
ncbi:MAG: MlaD family protein [Planctomycetota bacterium]